ncbi:hypothetical protein INT44_002791 [Umbelopsis vinacea]|uniref:Transaldolase n=1 Tax=Umbelopsis vinacea TaxID=44442 RepID=A0A8H7Q5P1_9FUNG|nr:hypothetical protein INT44_002791 [Umbelopsis vinacea]
MSTALDLVCERTALYMDTLDWRAAAHFNPVDATSNPFIVSMNLEAPHNMVFVDDAAKYAKAKGGSLEEQVTLAVLKTMVNLGTAAKPHLSGRVHTQLDARLAYSTDAMVAQTLQLVEMYKEAGLDKSQIAFKIPTTFQGVQACRVLERDHGVCCNMTVLFCLQQAALSAEAGASYVSPYLNLLGRVDGDPATGLANAQQIREYYDAHGIKTIVLGASFRTAEEVELMSQVADAVTVSPPMLEELKIKAPAKLPALPKIQVPSIGSFLDNEGAYQWSMTIDERSSIGLLEGLRFFAAYNEKLDVLLRSKLQSL